MVSVLAFYSDDPSSNPVDAYSFSVKFVFEKNQETGWLIFYFKGFFEKL